MKSNNRKSTDNIELVETYNIALALRRANNAPANYGLVPKRALFHAICMSGVFGNSQTETKIREALNLP